MLKRTAIIAQKDVGGGPGERGEHGGWGWVWGWGWGWGFAGSAEVVVKNSKGGAQN